MVSKTEIKRHKGSKHARYDRKIKRAKLKARSELDIFSWQKHKFYQNDYWIDSFVDTLSRIDYRQVSKQRFVEDYEAKNIPVVITHATDKWKASRNWTEEWLTDVYGSMLFKVGDDDNNKNVYLKMKHFLHYTRNEGLKDDSPLYIFDSGFYKSRNGTSNEKKQSSLLSDYKVPRYFSEDLFKLTGARRPPYRWLVIGGARSGTGIHKDPLGTSAWNALIKGHKRWCLFPPNTPKELYDPPLKKFDHEGISWFDKVYPTFKTRDPTDDENRTLGEKWGMVEVLQKPGETIFVPGGWAHVVMNLDLAIAVTQNFCSSTNAEYVYLQTRHSRNKLGQKLYREIQKLGELEPEIYGEVAMNLEKTRYIPQLPPSSSSDSSKSSSTSSSSSSSSSDTNGDSKKDGQVGRKRAALFVSSTDSETDQSDGVCMCKKCKTKRKIKRIRQRV